MTTKTDQSGRIVPPEEQAQKQVESVAGLKALILRHQDMIQKAVPAHIRSERMVRIVLTALGSVKYLAECEPVSFFGSVLQAAQLGLEPNTPLGHAYLIPRRNQKLKERSKGRYEREATLLVGYKGYVDLFYRSGQVAAVWADVVRKGDTLRDIHGLEPKMEHTYSLAENRLEQPLTHAYCVVQLKDGGRIYRLLSRIEIEKRRARSASPDDGPWVTDYDAMAMKTAARAIVPWVPVSAEKPQLQIAATVDDTERPIAEVADVEVIQMLEDSGFDLQGETK